MTDNIFSIVEEMTKEIESLRALLLAKDKELMLVNERAGDAETARKNV